MSGPSPDPAATARVERALAWLDQLDSRPTAQHAPLYAAVHRELSEVLAGAGAGAAPLATGAAELVGDSDADEPDDHRSG